MNRNVFALWHMNLKKIEINQKILNYCSCNNHKKIRQHKVSKVIKDFYFLKCCNCGEINVEYNDKKRNLICHLGSEKSFQRLTRVEKYKDKTRVVNYGEIFVDSYLSTYKI